MSFDDNELRRALDARSSPPSREFRDQLTSVLMRGPRRADLRPTLAAAAGVVLALAAVGVLVFAKQGGSPNSMPATKPSPIATSPVAAPSPAFVRGVLTAPPGPIALPANATLSAPSHEVVWALVIDQYLYRSTNHGQTWQQRPLPPIAGSTEISFINDNEGWLSATASSTPPCNGQAVRIWHTTDAGTTWQLLANGFGAAECESGLSFTDQLHGFIGASDTNGRAVVYFTKDGGLTWTASAVLADPPEFNGGLNLTPGRVHRFGSVLVVPVFGLQSNSASLFVFQTYDGGATWTYDAKLPNGGNSVAFVTALHWLQLIFPGQSTETTDGGRTWHTSSSDYSQAAPIAPEVDFADDRVGYATVRGGIALTVDGGWHWTWIKTPGT